MIKHNPTGDRSLLRRVWFIRGPSPGTVMWVQDMRSHSAIGLVKWGATWYLPVEDGTHIGIGIHNDNSFAIAVPTYIEARNIWEGGPAQPEQCSTDYMWEIMPGQTMAIDALMNPNAQKGRPLIIVPSESGLSIGENTFGTDQYRGQVHLYERQGDRPRMRQQSFRPEAGVLHSKGGGSFNIGATSKGLGSRESTGAAIGAGAEEHRSHRDTGLSYRRHAPQIAALQLEHREDLRAALGPIADFTWSMPIPRGNWWSSGEWGPWIYGGLPEDRVAPRIPVAQAAPHRPHR